ncbi:MAG: Uncharacterized protein FD124_2498 [Alphaproteobacteria bacterium]|nr:MAG: Uncharacterized protein FD124_2498 [Alphaproteobacteria bacterium]
MGTMPEDELPEGFKDELLDREQACAYLATIGVRRRPATLAKLFSTRSDGPPCIHDGRKPFYPKRPLHEWGVRQLTQLRRSSSERRRHILADEHEELLRGPREARFKTAAW